jgi:micrococcal nuclease
VYEYEAKLVSVHDGDTLRMDVDLGFSVHFLTANPAKDLPQSLRVYGYDAPELGRADGLGEKARDAVIAWFAAHPAPYRLHTVKDHSDKYGRYLADAIIASDDHELLNDQILAGWLKPYTGSGPKPISP